MSRELTDMVSEDEVNYKPWKYTGYKDLASYMASDQDFFAVRRFDRLHTRAILTLQARLEEFEEKLDGMDHEYASPQVMAVGKEPPEIIKVPPGGVSQEEQTRLDEKHGEWSSPRDINNGTVRDDMPERVALIDENHPGAIMPKESAFPDHEAELLSIPSGGGTVARRFFENSVLYPIGKSTSLFTKTPRFMTPRDAKNVHIFSDETTEAVATAGTFLVAALMLITPLWILQAIKSAQLKLGVITIFIVVFLGFLTYATTGRAFERLAATAGYCAVLVVFLQIGNDGV
ncbi:hypothetical protein PG984_007545 [Apiospora sp. TS-2023a]